MYIGPSSCTFTFFYNICLHNEKHTKRLAERKKNPSKHGVHNTILGGEVRRRRIRNKVSCLCSNVCSRHRLPLFRIIHLVLGLAPSLWEFAKVGLSGRAACRRMLNMLRKSKYWICEIRNIITDECKRRLGTINFAWILERFEFDKGVSCSFRWDSGHNKY